MIVTGLIFFDNFSTAALLFVTSLVLIFIGRVKFSYILRMVGIGLVFAGHLPCRALFPACRPTRASGHLEKQNNPLYSGEGSDSYQVEQAKIAIATGGTFGKMPGNSTQRNFLPHPYSDFIFAIIVEEYGVVGGIFVVLLYMILLFRAVKISYKVYRDFRVISGYRRGIQPGFPGND